jgi:hypothetical protein
MKNKFLFLLLITLVATAQPAKKNDQPGNRYWDTVAQLY